MNWQDIKISHDSKSFSYDGKILFNRDFLDVLKFHAPGLAAVQDHSGWYHIDAYGNQLYAERFNRTFGYYCNRAGAVQGSNHFHLNEKGIRAYSNNFSWTGNFQEDLCPVRNIQNEYFHIDLNGERIYSDNFVYVGDYKDGIACVKTMNGKFRHIDNHGNFINEKEFADLGIFHKNFATAKDQNGWYHIDKSGKELYTKRYSVVEPFYNGYALVEGFDNQKRIIDEEGTIVVTI